MSGDNPRSRALIPLGHVSGLYGVKGWVKIHSWTSPIQAVLDYQPWLMGEDKRPMQIVSGRLQGKSVIASLPGVTDRDQARAWIGAEIFVDREQLPELNGSSWYWTDLVGLNVETMDGQSLGEITKMIETGAHDVMVIKGDRERLVPFVPEIYVKHVDLKEQRLIVDWQADYLE